MTLWVLAFSEYLTENFGVGSFWGSRFWLLWEFVGQGVVGVDVVGFGSWEVLIEGVGGFGAVGFGGVGICGPRGCGFWHLRSFESRDWSFVGGGFWVLEASGGFWLWRGRSCM